MEKIKILLQEIQDLIPNKNINHDEVAFGTIYSADSSSYYFKNVKYKNDFWYIEIYYGQDGFYKWEIYNIYFPKKQKLIQILEEIKSGIIEYNEKNLLQLL